MHYYKRNIGDYAKKAGRLSMLEHGAYTLLMDACYDRERFPTEEEAMEWCWARTQEEKAAVAFVLRRFFDLQDGRYVQQRIADEVAKYQENAATNQRIAQEREERRRAKSAQKSTKRANESTNRADTVNASTTNEHEPPPNQEPLTKNQEPRTKNINTSVEVAAPAGPQAVFAHWVKVMGKNAQTLFTKDRQAKVKARLKEGYTVEQLCQAIDGCSRTPHNMGQNDQGQLFNDLELICRSGSQVDRFRQNASRVSPQDRREVQLDAWLNDSDNVYDGEYEYAAHG